MSQRAIEIANLLLSQGALESDNAEHREVREELLGDADLFDDVRRRLQEVGFRLVEQLGHLGVLPIPRYSGRRNNMGMHAGHIRLIVYLWTHLVYREWNDLRRGLDTAPPGHEQTSLFSDEPPDEPPSISFSHVRNEFCEVTSLSYLKGLLKNLRRWRFISYDEKRDRIWADASLYTMIDLQGMEDFVIDLARRLAVDEPAEAVGRIVQGSPVPPDEAGE